MSRPKFRWRYLVLLLLTCSFSVGLCILLTPGEMYWVADMLPGPVQHACEESISEMVRVRISFTEYVGEVFGTQVDPANWREHDFAWEFVAHRTVLVPYMDYEISYDDGQSWQIFWHQSNGQNNKIYPDCHLGGLSETHFWSWNEHGAAVTQDGGHHWLIRNRASSESGYLSVHFTDANSGRINRYSSIDLITTDGGATWREESAS